MKIFDLPCFDTRASFYGKAKVIEQDNGKRFYNPIIPTLRRSPQAGNLAAGADHINYDNIINQASENAGAVLIVPTLAELKAHIKIEKATHKWHKGYKPLWDFGEGLPRVDAAFLLEVLTILGDCKAVCGCASPTKQPLYFTNKSGDDAILLPVR